MNYKNILSYYKDCYKEDSADLNLWRLNKLKAEDRLVLTGTDDLASGFLPRLPLPVDFGEAIHKRVEIYQRERVLLHASFFVVGTVEVKGESRQIVAPLLFNEATVEKTGQDYYFSSLNQTPDINEALLEALLPERDLSGYFDNIDNLYDPSLWTALLKDSPLNLNVLDALNFPKLAEKTEITKALRRKSVSLLPVSMLVFVERATSSRGVLHELEKIIEASNLSAPITELFADTKQSLEFTKPLKFNYLPGLLSAPQKKIISIAAHASLGCVSGPPGTGKSYTIAAVAAEHMARGESVLIVANNDAALDVIADKLDQNFGLGDISVRAGQKEFLKQLKSYIADLLASYASNEHDQDPKTCESQLTALNKTLSGLEKRFVKFCLRAINRGQRLHQFQNNNAPWVTRVYLLLVGRTIRRLAKQWQALDDIHQQNAQREQLASEFLSAVKESNLSYLAKSHRKSLQAFNKAIRSRTSKRQLEFFEDINYEPLLNAFPVWLASLNSLHRVLPLNAEMFDVVIIDEATQCNISSCFPAFYRAKRAIVVGDTKQLKHYSFLAQRKEAQLMAKHDVTLRDHGIMSYRNNSILDLTLSALESQQQLAFLDEHFRSKPELIHFSNQHFYQGKLKVMQHRPCTSSGYLHVHRVNGERDKQGVNQQETDAVISAIRRQLADDKLTDINHSVGVISPFRHQAEHIANAIEAQFSEQQIKNHGLRAATPYGFQGEERDIMMIAFSVDNNASRAAAYLNKSDVFNVTITRARQKQLLFVSIEEKKLPEHNLLRKYLHSIGEFNAEHNNTSTIDDFQQEVMSALTLHNIEMWPGYTIAGIEVDLLCRHNGQYLAIDLIGFPGPWADFFELNTYKLLQRAGIEMLPLSYGLWTIEQQACVELVLKKFNISAACELVG